MAADHARRADPSLVARCHRPMVTCGKHHYSSLCHISTACWRGTPCQSRDTDGTPLTISRGRMIISQRYQVPAELRTQRRTTRTRTTGEPATQGVPGAPTTARPSATLRPSPAQTLDTLKNSTA